jgi:hypothetical protein
MFRFTIRELVLLTLVVAMGVGWWQEVRHRGPENARLRADNSRLAAEWKVMRRAWLSVVETPNNFSAGTQ